MSDIDPWVQDRIQDHLDELRGISEAIETLANRVELLYHAVRVLEPLAKERTEA